MHIRIYAYIKLHCCVVSGLKYTWTLSTQRQMISWWLILFAIAVVVFGVLPLVFAVLKHNIGRLAVRFDGYFQQTLPSDLAERMLVLIVVFVAVPITTVAIVRGSVYEALFMLTLFVGSCALFVRFHVLFSMLVLAGTALIFFVCVRIIVVHVAWDQCIWVSAQLYEKLSFVWSLVLTTAIWILGAVHQSIQLGCYVVFRVNVPSWIVWIVVLLLCSCVTVQPLVLLCRASRGLYTRMYWYILRKLDSRSPPAAKPTNVPRPTMRDKTLTRVPQITYTDREAIRLAITQ